MPGRSRTVRRSRSGLPAVSKSLLIRQENGAFSALQEQVDSEVMGRGLNEDVNVLRHEDMGDEPARTAVDGLIQTFRQEMPPLVVRQEWNPPIARESQLVTIARLVKSLDGLSMAVHGRRG